MHNYSTLANCGEVGDQLTVLRIDLRHIGGKLAQTTLLACAARSEAIAGG